MRLFADPVQPPLIVQHLAWALLHSLWIIFVIGALFFVANRIIRRTNLQYVVGCVSLGLVAASLPVTFCILTSAPSTDVGPVDQIVTEQFSVTSASFSDPLQPRLVTSIDRLVPWIILSWTIGISLVTFYQLFGWFRFQLLLRRTSRPLPRQFLRLMRTTKKLRVLRPIRLLESACLEVPATVGWLKPVVLIPAGALTGLSPEHLEAIVLHELAHIRRHDYLVNILQTVVETALFYHPVVWWISSKVRDSREACCDDIAVSELGSTHRYLRALTALEELRSETPLFVLAATGGSLLARAGRLLGDPTVHLFGRGRAALGAALLSLLLLAFLGSSLFANTQRVSELRLLEESASLATVVQNILNVRDRAAPFELLEPAVLELHTEPANEPRTLGLLAKRIASGVDPDALNSAMYSHLSADIPPDTHESLSWRYGTPKDHLRLVVMLWRRAERLRFSAPSEAEDAARAALLFAAQCSYSTGSALPEAVCREPHFCNTAHLTSLQMMQLQQLFADYSDVVAEFSTQSLHFLGDGGSKVSTFRRLTQLAKERPDLQLRLIRLLETIPQAERAPLITLVCDSADEQSMLMRWVRDLAPAREVRHEQKVVIGTSELLSHLRTRPTSRPADRH